MDRAMKTRLNAALLCGAAWACSAQAQALPDPTRPPAQMAAPAVTGVNGVAGAPGTPDASRPTLQSVLIARLPGGRRVAVIDGQTLRVGDKFQGAVLASVSDNQAVLLRGSDRQVLRLYPGTDAAPGAPAPRPPSSR